MRHMDIYSRHLAARDLSEALFEQYLLEREGHPDGADAISDRAHERLRKLAQSMGYSIQFITARAAA